MDPSEIYFHYIWPTINFSSVRKTDKRKVFHGQRFFLARFEDFSVEKNVMTKVSHRVINGGGNENDVS